MIELDTLTDLLHKRLPFGLNWLPPDACLVGGAVRDALLNHWRDYLDLDFVLPQKAVETAKSIADRYQAGFVILDKTRQIARVVFKQGTVDFAQQEGECLETDLRRRDFTINAIAYSFHQQKIIDPLRGFDDLERRTVRMVSRQNLRDDPLRLLRAYRQAAQLNFTIEPTTRSAIRTLARLINQVAAERVQSELGYLLAHPKGSDWLHVVWEDGLLQPWFQALSQVNLQNLIAIDRVTQCLKKKLGKDLSDRLFANTANQSVPPAIRLAKLATLVATDPEIAERELVNLKYSRVEVKTVTKALKGLLFLTEKSSSMSLREQYFFFLEVGHIFPTLAMLALVSGSDRAFILELIDRYLNPGDQVAHPQPLITGNDLIKQLHLKPSPQIGTLLTEIQLVSIEGKISTPQEAIQFARMYLEKAEGTMISMIE